jgi:nucleoside phosphorylase
MIIVIVSAVADQQKAVLSVMKNQKQKDGYTFGTISGVNCVSAISEIGYLAAQRQLVLMIQQFDPRFVIFLGTARAGNIDAKVGNVYVSGYVLGSDCLRFLDSGEVVKTNTIQLEKNGKIENKTVIPGYKYYCDIAEKNGAIIGVIGSNSSYVDNVSWANFLNSLYHIDVAGKEGIGFAYAAEQYDKEFVIFKTIRDSVYDENEGLSVYDASVMAAKILECFLKDIDFTKYHPNRINMSDLSSGSLSAQHESLFTKSHVMPPTICNSASKNMRSKIISDR